jgi:hypothetical protein
VTPSTIDRLGADAITVRVGLLGGGGEKFTLSSSAVEAVDVVVERNLRVLEFKG